MVEYYSEVGDNRIPTPQTPYPYISYLNRLKFKCIHNRTDWTSKWNKFFWEKNTVLLSLLWYTGIVCNFKVNVSRPSCITTFRPILHHVLHKIYGESPSKRLWIDDDWDVGSNFWYHVSNVSVTTMVEILRCAQPRESVQWRMRGSNKYFNPQSQPSRSFTGIETNAHKYITKVKTQHSHLSTWWHITPYISLISILMLFDSAHRLYITVGCEHRYIYAHQNILIVLFSLQ